jgi:8-oxo-dGTP pyrophosphatase MutT (NUDIX family)
MGSSGMSGRRVPVSRVELPRGFTGRVPGSREAAERGLTPTVPRDAATVVLLRQAPGGSGSGSGAPGGSGSGASGVSGVSGAVGGSGVEVFLLRRTEALEFAPGALVFPGGSVDEHDADPQIGWAGPSPAEFAARLGTSPEHARALVCAAVRETLEESGVLLAGAKEPPHAAVLQDSAALARDRHALLDGSVSLGELLARRRLVVRADLLTPWARWITPEISPRRFDTWFFAAALPPGQTAAIAADAPAGLGPAESDSGTWLRPSAALDAARAGEIILLPPTAVTLGELAAHRDLAAILAARRTIAPLLPKVVIQDGQAWLDMPQAVDYPL